MQANVHFAPYIGYESLLFADNFLYGASPEQLWESFDGFQLFSGIARPSASLGGAFGQPMVAD
jgi:hypothetical protein